MWATSSDSDTESDDEYECTHTQTAWFPQREECLYEPFQRNQGYFLANLAKLLDEAEAVRMNRFIRWDPANTHAMQINWPEFVKNYPDIHDTLAAYKMVRSNNSVVSARASWNRKLREWNFKMSPPIDMEWTTYTYSGDVFHKGCDYYALPNQRR